MVFPAVAKLKAAADCVVMELKFVLHRLRFDGVNNLILYGRCVGIFNIEFLILIFVVKRYDIYMIRIMAIKKSLTCTVLAAFDYFFCQVRESCNIVVKGPNHTF